MTAAFLIRAAISGLLVALIALVARRSPGLGGLIASIPLVSTLAMIWLWRDTQDTGRIAEFATSTFVYFLPSIPMFLIIPLMLRQGFGFWVTLGVAVAVTMLLYLITARIASAYGIAL